MSCFAAVGVNFILGTLGTAPVTDARLVPTVEMPGAFTVSTNSRR